MVRIAADSARATESAESDAEVSIHPRPHAGHNTSSIGRTVLQKTQAPWDVET